MVNAAFKLIFVMMMDSVGYNLNVLTQRIEISIAYFGTYFGTFMNFVQNFF